MGLDSEAEEIIYSIRRTLVDYIGTGNQSTQRLKDVFAEIDRNGNNRIDRYEFKHAFTVLGINLTNRDVNLIFDHFDADGSDDFNYREFLELLDTTPASTEAPVDDGVMKVSEEICSTLRRKIEDRFGTGFKKDMTVLDLFEEADEQKTGRIYRKEIINILHSRLGIRPQLSMEDLDTIFERFERRRNATSMEYAPFVNKILGRDQQHSLKQIMITQTNEMIDLIHQQLTEAFGAGKSMRDRLKFVFHNFERDDRLTKKGLIAILLDELRIEGLRLREIEYLFDRFDISGMGAIDYTELLDLLTNGTKPKSPLSKKSSMSVVEVIEAIRKALYEELGDAMHIAPRMKEVFAAIDRNGNGRLERSELQMAMETLKLELTPSEIQLLIQRFDHDNSGNFDYKEFVEMISPIRK